MAAPLHRLQLRRDARRRSPPKEIEISEWNLQNAVHVRAQNNEGVLYRGQELVHYRPPLPAGHELMQVVFAWRIANEVACNAGGRLSRPKTRTRVASVL